MMLWQWEGQRVGRDQILNAEKRQCLRQTIPKSEYKGSILILKGLYSLYDICINVH